MFTFLLALTTLRLYLLIRVVAHKKVFNIYVAAAKMLLTGDGMLKARVIVPDAKRPAVQFLKN